MPGTASALYTIGQTVLTASAFGVSVGQVLGTAAVNYAINAAAKEFQEEQQQPEFDRSINAQFRSPNEPRKIVYGRTKKSGPVVFHEVTPSEDSKENLSSSEASHYVNKSSGDDVLTNEYLHIVVPVAGHQIEEFEAYYMDGNKVDVDTIGTPPSYNVTGSDFYQAARLVPHLGAPDQSADQDLVFASSKWTDQHRLRNIAYVYAQLKWDRDDYDQIPELSFRFKGKNTIYDPRDDSTGYTHNPALCIADYMTLPVLGLGIDWGKINESSLIEAANICEEQMDDNQGGTHDRYALNGVVNTANKPEQNLRSMLNSMMGSIEHTNGQYHIRAGSYSTPTVELDENDARGPIQITTSNSRRDKFNKVKGEFISPENNWQPSDFPSQSFQQFIDEDNGEIETNDLKLDYTIDQTRAMRLGKINLSKNRRDTVVKFPAKLNAMKFRVGDTLNLTLSKYPFDKKTFRVVKWEFAFDSSGDAPSLGVDLHLKETDTLVFDNKVGYGEQGYGEFGYGGTIGEIPIATPDTNFGDTTEVDPVTNVNAVSQGRATIQKDGSVISRVVIDWDPPNDAFVQSGGQYEVQYRKSTQTEWSGSLMADAGVTQKEIENLIINEEYDFHVRAYSGSGASSDWTTVTNHSIDGDVTSPAVPTGLSSQRGTGKSVQLFWDANDEEDLDEYGIYRNTTNDAASAAKIAETGANSFVDAGVQLGQTYFYWVTAVDGSENESDYSDETSITPEALGDDEVSDVSPSAPGAMTKTGDSVYKSGDGTVFATLDFEVPAMPDDARYQNVIYKKTTSTEWQIAAQFKNENKVEVSIDDLAPNVFYQVALRAYSAFGEESTTTDADNSPYATPGLEEDPPEVSNFESIVTPGEVENRWDPIAQPDIKSYEVRAHRSSGVPLDSASDSWKNDVWNNASQKTDVVGEKKARGDIRLPEGEWLVMVKGFDRSGNESPVPAINRVNVTDSGFVPHKIKGELSFSFNLSCPVTIKNNIAYFYKYTFDEIVSVDISDKSNPQHIATFQDGMLGPGDGDVVAVPESDAILVTSSYGVVSINASDPANLQIVDNANSANPTDLEIRGGYVFSNYEGNQTNDSRIEVAEMGGSGDTIYFGNTASVSLSAPGGSGMNRLRHFDVSGDFLFYAARDKNSGDGYLGVVDVSDSMNPTQIATSSVVPDMFDSFGSIKHSNGYVYVSSQTNDTGDVPMHVFDVIDPTNPVHVTQKNMVNSGLTTDFNVRGPFLYGVKQNYFYTAGLENKSNPDLVKAFDLTTTAVDNTNQFAFRNDSIVLVGSTSNSNTKLLVIGH